MADVVEFVIVNYRHMRMQLFRADIMYVVVHIVHNLYLCHSPKVFYW